MKRCGTLPESVRETKRRRHLEYKTFFDWFIDNSETDANIHNIAMVNLILASLLKDDLWPNPLQYYLVPDIEVEPEEGENRDEFAEEEQFEEEEEDGEDEK